METSDELDKFRLNWVNEINNNNSKSISTASSKQKSIDDAVALYYQAAQSEEDGDLSGAVVLLRKAYRLDPDLDRHVRELLAEEKKGEKEQQKKPPEKLPELNKEFFEKFENINLEDNNSNKQMFSNCNGYELLEPESFLKGQIHLLDLPDECLCLILQYLVGRRMDFYSLNQLKRTCKYATKRIDSNHYLWSLMATRSIYGNAPKTASHQNQSIHSIVKNSKNSSGMPVGKFILKKLGFLRFQGVYVSRITYFRDGEPDMDGFYKPFHHVVYYRLVLFYEDAKTDCLKCVYFTSPLEPKDILNKMMNLVKHGTTEEGIHIGNNVVCELCFDEEKSSSYLKLTADLVPCNHQKILDKEVTHRMTWVIRKKKLIWQGHTYICNNFENPDRSMEEDFFKTSSRETYPDMTFTPVKILKESENSYFINKKL